MTAYIENKILAGQLCHDDKVEVLYNLKGVIIWVIMIAKIMRAYTYQCW